MLDEDVEITKQVEDAKYNRDGTRTSFVRIEFHVGKHGPFVERLDKATYSAQTRDDRLNAFAREVRT